MQNEFKLTEIEWFFNKDGSFVLPIIKNLTNSQIYIITDDIRSDKILGIGISGLGLSIARLYKIDPKETYFSIPTTDMIQYYCKGISFNSNINRVKGDLEKIKKSQQKIENFTYNTFVPYDLEKYYDQIKACREDLAKIELSRGDVMKFQDTFRRKIKAAYERSFSERNF